MCLDKTSHGCRFPAERLSFSGDAEAIVEKMTEMTVTEKETITNAL